MMSIPRRRILAFERLYWLNVRLSSNAVPKWALEPKVVRRFKMVPCSKWYSKWYPRFAVQVIDR